MLEFSESYFNSFNYGDIFVGKDIYNNNVFINLEECPHILIAGMTGSGKSVALNSIICSLLKTYAKYDIEFLMIDTKRVELSPYKRLGKENCIFIADTNKAIEYLKKICNLIEARYSIMEKDKIRNGSNYFYKQIVIIEELGDLMYESQKEIEKYLVKIARLGRACGVHLVIATQRPTVNVVTGEIKANIGCRLALQTTSVIDSINILGHKGCELLKGKGDCLLKLPTLQNEIHIQCPYIDDETINKIINEY